jgi:hypothetical protein
MLITKILNSYQRILLHDDRGCIKFGPSIFHAYVHNWLCQLQYNPRFNTGWGLSNGKGLERMWSYLAPLVSPLRYAIRNHCLGAIAHQLKYHNQKGINQLSKSLVIHWHITSNPAQIFPILNSCLVQWLRRKFNNAIKRQSKTRSLLAGLLGMQNPHKSSGERYTQGFFKRQWQKQRSFQSQHTQKEDDRRQKLVNLCKEEAVLEYLRYVSANRLGINSPY